MPPDTNDILYAPLGTMTYKRGADGFLYVTGTVSTDSLDLDNQRCDPEWLEKEIPEWFKSAGNFRVMHQPQTGGKAKELTQVGNSWITTVKVTNPQTATDIEEEVLTGMSIGIKGARVDKSTKALELAPEGVINGGKIVEVSFVDRPANPDCKMSIAKMAGGELTLSTDVEIVESVEEVEVEVKSPLSSISKGFADLTKAVTHDPAELNSIRSSFVTLIKAELDELDSGADDETNDLYQLLSSLSTFLNWWDDEADEGETTEPFPEGDDTMAYVGLGVSADLIKSASADDATDEVKSELRTEIVKALGLAEIATKAEFDGLQEVIKGLEATLKDVREMAAPGQPALRATLDQQNKSAEADELEIKANRYLASAYAQTDKSAAAQYVDAADTLNKRVRELRATTL